MNKVNNHLAFLAVDFYKELYNSMLSENILICPPVILSLVNTLGKVMSGKGADQLLNTIGLSLPPAYNLAKILDEIIEISPCESLFYVNSKKTLTENCQDQISQAGITSFITNDWIDILKLLHTLGYTAKDMYKISHCDSIITYNIEFIALWENIFKDYGSGLFFSDTRIRTVPYIVMSGTLGHSFYRRYQMHIVNIPYLHNKYSLLLFFTYHSKMMKIFEENITSTFLVHGTTFTNMYYTDISIALPKFSLITKHATKQILLKMGVTDIFDKTTGSMKNITTDECCLSRIYIKCRVDFINNRIPLFDQRKWEPCSTFYMLDRPFMFCIKYNKSNTILFLGKINDPVL